MIGALSLSLIILFLILIFNHNLIGCSVRKKRYVTFPEGSTFTFAFCMTLKALTYGDIDIFSEAVAVAVNYDLPSNSSDLPLQDRPHSVASSTLAPLQNHYHVYHNSREPFQNHYYAHQKRRARAERALIYQKGETILNRIGMDGRSCVMRSLCEAVQLLPGRQSLMHRIIALIFMIPMEMMDRDEERDVWQYRAAQLSGLYAQVDCQQLFPKCPLSLLALALSLRSGHI